MWLRRIHRILGLVVGPFLLLTSVTGFLVLGGLRGWYRFELRRQFVEWHNLGVISEYASFALAVGLFLLAGTGLALRVQIWRRTRRKKHAR